jgi:hypothetical protein
VRVLDGEGRWKLYGMASRFLCIPRLNDAA